MMGDYRFESGRRAQAMTTSKLGVPVWRYLFEHYPLEQPGSHWGVHHGAEIPYGKDSISHCVLLIVAITISVFGSYVKREDEHGDVSKYLMTAWVKFAHDLDPNGPSPLGKMHGV